MNKILNPDFTNFLSYKMADGNKVCYSCSGGEQFKIVKYKGVQGGNASSYLFNATQFNEFDKKAFLKS